MTRPDFDALALPDKSERPSLERSAVVSPGCRTTSSLQSQKPGGGPIGLFGGFGVGNTGNDGSLEGMLMLLRQHRMPDQLVCICGNPERVAISHGIRTINLSASRLNGPVGRVLNRFLFRIPSAMAGWAHALNTTRRLDSLIVPGTGILDDFGERPSGIPYALFRWCMAARLNGINLAFVSIGAGPIRHPLSRLLMKSAVRLAHYRSYRDTPSLAFIQSMGLNASRDRVYPDLAFKLPVTRDVAASSSSAEPTIGVGIMTYSGWAHRLESGAEIYATYLSRITEFLLALLDRGLRVRLLMGDSGDQKAVDDVLQRLKQARPTIPASQLVVEPAHSLDDVMRQISGVSYVVATRFHNVVCALKLGKPTISIGYADKNDALLSRVGLGDFCQDITRLDVSLLLDQLAKLMKCHDVYRERIRRATAEFQQDLLEQDQAIAALLL